MAATLNDDREREQFNEFLFDLPDKLDELRAEAARFGFDLDGTVTSLNALENFYLALISDEPIKNSVVEQVELTAPAYLGEVVRTNFGGKWELNIENPKHLYYRQPVIVGHSRSVKLQFCPFFVFNSFRVQKRQGLLIRAVKESVQPQPLDLSSLPTED